MGSAPLQCAEHLDVWYVGATDMFAVPHTAWLHSSEHVRFVC